MTTDSRKYVDYAIGTVILHRIRAILDMGRFDMQVNVIGYSIWTVYIGNLWHVYSF